LENFSVTAIVDVYKDGDINLTVGPNSEWFPFNPVRQATLIRKAFAEAAVSPAGKYVQTQREEGRTIVRERIYENGFRETVVIDQNTGQTIRRSTEMRPLSAEEKARVEQGIRSRPPIIIR